VPQVPKAILPAVEMLAADGGRYFGDEMFGEMQGIARCTGLNLGDVVIVNLFYELNSACTSIVAQRSSDGAIFHGRNLDYGIPGLQNVTMNVAFTRGGDTVFHTTTYGGYIGALTGMRPGAFSVSLDQRFTPDSPWENAIEALLHKGKSVGVALRELLETTDTCVGWRGLCCLSPRHSHASALPSVITHTLHAGMPMSSLLLSHTHCTRACQCPPF